MKKFMFWLSTFFSWLIFALMTFAVMFFIVGAFRAVNSFFLGELAGVLELISLGAIMLIGGVIGAVLFIIDTKDD